MLRLIYFLCITLLISLFAQPGWANTKAYKVGYIFTTHHTPLLVAATKGEAFKNQGIYLKPLVAKESYALIENEKTIAILDFVVTKSGSETATLFAQKHLDLAIASITAIMAGIDKGTPIKIVCPLQTEGMALMAPKNSPLNNWDSLIAAIWASKEPFRIGFHSPTSAPKIVLEGGLTEAGLSVTLNPSDTKADVLLVDLKETSNLLASLSSGQVEAVVGPSPFPEVAQVKGLGKVVVQLGDMPPHGKWSNFPCCVGVASEEMLNSHKDVVTAFVSLIKHANAWCNEHQQEAGAIAAQWIGLPEEAGKKTTLIFMNEFSDNWLAGAASYLKILNSMKKFSGKLAGKSLEEVKSLLLDSTILDSIKL